MSFFLDEVVMDADHEAPYAALAVGFASALMAGDFVGAHRMLSPSLRGELAPDALRESYQGMIEYGEGPALEAVLITTMQRWPDRQPKDLGWAYVAIEGDGYSEAVTVVVEAQPDGPRIRSVEWGRP